MKGVVTILFHPFVGIIRIRLEGIISAHNREHPLKSAAKVQISGQITKQKRKFFDGNGSADGNKKEKGTG